VGRTVDKLTCQHPFAAGLTISEFKAVSTDGNWVEAFIQSSLGGVHKVRLIMFVADYGLTK
jgi:vacuolar protein sorting-associated protein 13A/C